MGRPQVDQEGGPGVNVLVACPTVPYVLNVRNRAWGSSFIMEPR